ncbi:MAG: hypothetical protein WBF81_03995 [Thermoplasmata archaeon]
MQRTKQTSTWAERQFQDLPEIMPHSPGVKSTSSGPTVLTGDDSWRESTSATGREVALVTAVAIPLRVVE